MIDAADAKLAKNCPSKPDSYRHPQLKELGLDILGGFLSGLFLSGAKSGYNAIQFTRMGQEAFDTGSYRDYISHGLLADHDSEAYQYAQEIRAKLNAGRTVTNIEMGQLTAAIYADALGVGEKRNAEVPDDYVRDGVLEEDDTVFQQALMEEMGLETEAIYNTETGLSNGSNGDIIEHKTGVHIGNSAGTKLLDAFAQLTNEEVAALTNVWNDITPTQPNYPGTDLPRSFIMKTAGETLWVHGNATEHMAEYLIKQGNSGHSQGSTKLSTQLLVYDMQQSLGAVIKDGIVFGRILHYGNWDFIINKARNGESYDVVIHALLKK